MSGFYNDQDDTNTTRKTIAGAVAAASLVFLVFLVLLYQTTRDKTPKNAAASQVIDQNITSASLS